MSWMIFNFPDDTEIQVDGRERVYFEVLTEDCAKGTIGAVSGLGSKSLDAALRPYINPDGSLGEFLQREPSHDGRLEQALGYMIHTGGFRTGATPFAWKGQGINTRQLVLNTALAAGSDALRIAVKIAWQCEIHGYVMGFHRKWLADLIQEGLEENLYHRGLGWEELVTKLRETNDGPVVASSSKTDPFPNAAVANWKGTEEDWATLGFTKQWDAAVKGLKAPGRNQPWSPKNLRTLRFGHELSLLDLIRGDTERIEKGLKIA